MDKLVPIPKGALLTVTSGVYSDFCVQGVFRALGDIDVGARRDDWLVKYPDQAGEYTFRETDFLASFSHLLEPVDCWELYLTDYLLEPVDCWELHLTDYSRASEIDVMEPSK